MSILETSLSSLRRCALNPLSRNQWYASLYVGETWRDLPTTINLQTTSLLALRDHSLCAPFHTHGCARFRSVRSRIFFRSIVVNCFIPTAVRVTGLHSRITSIPALIPSHDVTVRNFCAHPARTILHLLQQSNHESHRASITVS